MQKSAGWLNPLVLQAAGDVAAYTLEALDAPGSRESLPELHEQD
jgi:hypothetical protein